MDACAAELNLLTRRRGARPIEYPTESPMLLKTRFGLLAALVAVLCITSTASAQLFDFRHSATRR